MQGRSQGGAMALSFYPFLLWEGTSTDENSRHFYVVMYPAVVTDIEVSKPEWWGVGDTRV